MNNETQYCVCGPSFWDVVLLVGAGFILGITVSAVIGMLVVVK